MFTTQIQRNDPGCERMKRKKNFDTVIEYNDATMAHKLLNEWMKEVSTDAQRRAWNFATTTPQQRSNVNLARTWGETKTRSFTLTENTREWLSHLPSQSGSKTVEVALCRYRVWPLLLEYIGAMTTECRNAKRRVKELEAELGVLE